MNSTGSQADKVLQAVSNAVLLGADDNVVVACRFIRAGEAVSFAGRSIIAAEDIATGHKIACHPINPGKPVIKYGAPIGSATEVIAVGEHVHLHNLRSNYIATFTRSTGSNT